MDYSVSVVAGGVTVLLALKLYQMSRASGRLPHPPGPPGDYLIGNVRQMPHTYAWKPFTEWGRQYGVLTYLDVAGLPILVLNSQDAAVDLLEKRAAIYSDRPRFVMTAELCGMQWGTALKPYGPELKKHRQLLNHSLRPRVVQQDFVPLQERFTYKFARSLLDDPIKFSDHAHRLMGEIILTLTYGSCYDGDTDLVALGDANMSIFGKTSTGYLVDSIPALRFIPEWFPGAQFKRDAKAWRVITEATRRQPFEMLKRQRAAGEIRHATFTSSLLDDNDAAGGDPSNEQFISEVAATLFSAGSETLVSTTLTFILAMTRYPEIQAKAQAEIDRVVGKDRLPTMSDKNSLPYLSAVLMETLRWHPVTPTGLPHRLTQDDVYNGYHIPAGTLIMVNLWGILHDEHHFSDPLEFLPERYLPLVTGQKVVEGDPSAAPVDPLTMVFGYGRRSCPGIHLAQTGLWTVMAMLLSSFDIKPRVDPETGKPLVPAAEWTGDLISFPKPFACDITPRSKERAELIRQAVSEDS